MKKNILFATEGFYPVKNAADFYELNMYNAIIQDNNVDLFVITGGESERKSFIKEYDIKGISIGKYNKDRFVKRTYGESSRFKEAYATDFSNELYDLINSDKYDFILTSNFVLDKSRVKSNKVKLVYIGHDTMSGFVKESSNNYTEESLKLIEDYELNIIKENVDILIALSMLDLNYYSQSHSYVRYLPTIVYPNENQYKSNYDIKYDIFFGGCASWFRTYLSTSELLRLTEKYDLKSYIYLPRLIATHRLDYDPNKTVLDKSSPNKFNDEVHGQVKYSTVLHLYESGFPTKINIGLSNGMPILVKGKVTRYLTEEEASLCKNIVKGYDTDEEFKQLIDEFSPKLKTESIDFVKDYRSPSYIGGIFNKILEDYK